MVLTAVVPRGAIHGQQERNEVLGAAGGGDAAKIQLGRRVHRAGHAGRDRRHPACSLTDVFCITDVAGEIAVSRRLFSLTGSPGLFRDGAALHPRVLASIECVAEAFDAHRAARTDSFCLCYLLQRRGPRGDGGEQAEVAVQAGAL